MGFEGGGIVRKVGPGATRFSVGDRVMYIGTSCFTTQHAMKEALCIKIEDAMSFEQSAAMPCVYTTALMALVDRANLQKGQVCFHCPYLSMSLETNLMISPRLFSSTLQLAASVWLLLRWHRSSVQR